jgi:hypothetical protein
MTAWTRRIEWCRLHKYNTKKRKLKTAPIYLKIPPFERAPRAHSNHINHPKTRPNPATPARPQQPKTRTFTAPLAL